MPEATAQLGAEAQLERRSGKSSLTDRVPEPARPKEVGCRTKMGKVWSHTQGTLSCDGGPIMCNAKRAELLCKGVGVRYTNGRSGSPKG